MDGLLATVEMAETEIALPWANYVNHWSVSIGRLEVCWQPYAVYIHDADLLFSNKQTGYCLTIG